MQKQIIKITQENTELLKREEFQCFILTETLADSFKKEFCAAAKSAGKLVLFDGSNAADDYLHYGAAGLIIDVSKEENPQKLIKEIQKNYPRAVLGVICRNRRHEAMLVSECEPDFLIFRVWAEGFAHNLELLQWYNELFLLQNAVWPAEKIDLSQIPTDFVIFSDTDMQIFVAK